MNSLENRLRETNCENLQKPKTKAADVLLQFFPSVLFGVCFLSASIWRAITSGSPSLDLFLISAAALATLLMMHQRLPLQNVVGLIVVIVVFWWATLLIARMTGIFLAPPRFGFNFVREYEFGLFWTCGFILARGIAKLLLHRLRRNENFGLWLIALASLLIAIENPSARQGFVQFGARFLFAVLAFASLTPWFIDKKRLDAKPDFQPLFITFLLLLW